jgi:hypothetical protein
MKINTKKGIGMQYCEQITSDGVEHLIRLLLRHQYDPQTIAFVLKFLGDRIARSISPLTIDEAISGVFVDAIENVSGILNQVQKVSSSKW